MWKCHRKLKVNESKNISGCIPYLLFFSVVVRKIHSMVHLPDYYVLDGTFSHNKLENE
ncbi:hypothetical protein [Vaccinia virus]|uniref:Uncharacterized protein n=1 Tax=Vaccinia virus TaxID=10245 RepID=A0A2I6J1L2_VACCV|nr:hypothetical protein [Vaccinia virus]